MKSSGAKYTLLAALFSIVCIITYSQEESIVRVHAYKNANTFNVGTGTIIRFSGNFYIATCYHVIAKSRTVKVFSQYGELDGIRLVAYDNIKDLALLRFDKKYNINKGIELADFSTNLIQYKAKTLGHPNNWELQDFPVSITSNNLVSNSTLIGLNNLPIFKFVAKFDVITLSSTIYGGMSGSPLIINGRLSGVISGALNNGGTIAWAIPAKYFNSLSFKTPIRDFSTLPEYNALRPGNQQLSKSYEVKGNPSKEHYSSIVVLYNKIDDSYEEMKNFINNLNLNINQAEPIYDKIIQTNINTYSALQVESLISDLDILLNKGLDSFLDKDGNYIYDGSSIEKALETYDDILYELEDQIFDKVLDEAIEKETEIESLGKILMQTNKVLESKSIEKQNLEEKVMISYENWQRNSTYDNFNKYKILLEPHLDNHKFVASTIIKYYTQLGEIIGKIKALTDFVYEAKYYQQ